MVKKQHRHFEKKLKDFTAKKFKYFEINPAIDCCPECEAKANKKIKILTATKDDIPPFHKKCRCDILPLDKDQEAESFKKLKHSYEIGEFPMKRCPHCSQWIPGNAVECNYCNKKLL